MTVGEPGTTKTKTKNSLNVNVSLSLDAQSSLEFVSLSRNVFESLYGTVADIKGKYVLLKLPGSNVLNIPQVYPITIKHDLNDNQVEIESLKLLQNYGSDFTAETANIRKLENVPRLENIVISFPEEVYSILKYKHRDYIHELLAKERESTLDFAIIKKGDISHTLHGNIIHADPYEQGYIDRLTTLTIVKNDLNFNFASKNSTNSIKPTTNNDKISKSDVDPFDSFDMSMSLSSINETEINKSLDESVKFDVKALETNFLQEYTKFSKYSEEFPYEDKQLFACLSFNGFQKLHCLSGDLVVLKLNDQNNQNSPVYIRIFPFIEPCSFDDNSIYLSPLLIVALSNPKTVNISFIPNQNHQRADLPRYKLNKFVPLAREIVISRVSTPITTDRSLQYLFLANLKAYFESSHRVIMKNQLIPIALDSSLAKSIHQTYGLKGWYPEVIPEGNPDCIAWFMVSNGTFKDPETDEIFPIESNTQYMVNSQRTRMLQSGITKCDLNEVNFPMINRYLKIRPLFEFPNIQLPTGKVTFQYAKTLRKIFDTSIKIKNKINLQTTILLTSNTRFVGKATLVKTICENFGSSLVELDGYELLNLGMGMPGVTIGIIRGKLDRLIEQCDRLVVFIKHIECICKKGDEQQAEQKSIDDSLSLNLISLVNEYTSKGVIFIASTNDPDNINDIFRSKIKFEIDVNVPSEPERKEIFKYLVNFPNDKFNHFYNQSDKYQYLAGDDVNIDTLALQSAALTANDLVYIIKNVKLNALNRIKEERKKAGLKLNDIIDLNGGYVRLTTEDFESSINKARNKFSDSIGAPRIPNVKWEDVGGLDVVKNEILDTIEMPLKHPELFGSGMKKRSGLLFYGPPGTGKTLLAKAIATNFSLNFFSVKGPELLNMYIGESEANVRRVFERARDAKPCVIFFDELDSVAPRRGNQGDSGGVMDRIVSQLLAELDGMSGGEGDGVFVVGASNRPDLLDEALLRPGRFDKMLYLGISDTHEKQAKIISALTRKFNLAPDLNLQEIADTCPFNFTGADFYALCSDAMLNAMIRTAKEVDKKLEKYNSGRREEERLNLRQWFEKVAGEEDLAVAVCGADFAAARAELVASVSEEELAHYLRVRANFEGGKK